MFLVRMSEDLFVLQQQVASTFTASMLAAPRAGETARLCVPHWWVASGRSAKGANRECSGEHSGCDSLPSEVRRPLGFGWLLGFGEFLADGPGSRPHLEVDKYQSSARQGAARLPYGAFDIITSRVLSSACCCSPFPSHHHDLAVVSTPGSSAPALTGDLTMTSSASRSPSPPAKLQPANVDPPNVNVSGPLRRLLPASPSSSGSPASPAAPSGPAESQEDSKDSKYSSPWPHPRAPPAASGPSSGTGSGTGSVRGSGPSSSSSALPLPVVPARRKRVQSTTAACGACRKRKSRVRRLRCPGTRMAYLTVSSLSIVRWRTTNVLDMWRPGHRLRI